VSSSRFYVRGATINQIIDRINEGAAVENGTSTHFYPEDLKTLADYIGKFTKSVTPDHQPTYTVKLETDDLDEIKAIVDDGATLVIERGGGKYGYTIKRDVGAYVLESTSGINHITLDFADAFGRMTHREDRQIYVDYPIPPTVDKASPKSKAREELDQAESLWGEMPTGYTSNCIQHIMRAVEALIEGAK
jgi:hypothetical protein